MQSIFNQSSEEVLELKFLDLFVSISIDDSHQFFHLFLGKIFVSVLFQQPIELSDLEVAFTFEVVLTEDFVDMLVQLPLKKFTVMFIVTVLFG